jgi:hypothetical protein
MDFKPDYGVHLMKEGFSSATTLNFYDFRLFSLTVLGRGQYSTMVDMPYAGELHALSLDFTETQLEKILAKAPPAFRVSLKAQLATDPTTPRTIDFDGEVSFGVRARLGKIQKVQQESFVPLVAEEIL